MAVVILFIKYEKDFDYFGVLHLDFHKFPNQLDIILLLRNTNCCLLHWSYSNVYYTFLSNPIWD